METRDEVWRWMLDYQKQEGRLAKMEEIKEAHDTLNWRSSVRHDLQILLGEGRVEVVDEPGTARRYRALPLPKEETVPARLDRDFDMAIQYIPFQMVE